MAGVPLELTMLQPSLLLPIIRELMTLKLSEADTEALPSIGRKAFIVFQQEAGSREEIHGWRVDMISFHT